MQGALVYKPKAQGLFIEHRFYL